ncbi:MAG: DUF2384 domain-containing protein [Saprospiraceae bacterium]|nr:DUF2384 domain-containing protein [Saprospiraceae bacterium]
MQNPINYSIKSEPLLWVIHDPSAVYEGDIISSIRKGITRRQFMAFVKEVKQSVSALAEVIPASYSSLTKKDRYDKATSERMVELAEVFAQGSEVFGDVTKFNSWLESTSQPLGGVTPFSLLDTSIGISLVKDELGNIDHGIIA